MSARPWMPLYIADFLADTAHLNAAETGAYLLLIMHYWQKGELPKKEQKLARIARLSMRDWCRYRATLKSFFHGRWKHERIDKELSKVADLSAKRSASAQQMHSKRTAKTMQEHTHSHSQPHTDKEEESNSSPPARRTAKKKKISPIPEGWKPPDRAFEIAENLGLTIPPIEATFRDYLASSGRQYADYDAGFCNFVRNQPKFNGAQNGRNGGNATRANGYRAAPDALRAGMAEALSRRPDSRLFAADDSAEPGADDKPAQLRLEPPR